MIESTPIQTGFGAESTIWDVVEGIDSPAHGRS